MGRESSMKTYRVETEILIGILNRPIEVKPIQL